jgi:hypothetical protein
MDYIKTILGDLKNLGCSGIKISFEDEGALLNEMIIMRYLTASLHLELSIKIGGCEAKRDISESIDLCCDAIVAPMIESKFSLMKFNDSLISYNYSNKKGFNFETINAYNNINSISTEFTKYNFVTFGRVDFVKSLDKNREYVDSEEIYNIVKDTFIIAKKNNIQCYLGGAISINSYNFIYNLSQLNLIDKFETRYVIFDISKIKFEEYNTLLYTANLFEIEWLKYIRNKYLVSANKDTGRIKMMEERIAFI